MNPERHKKGGSGFWRLIVIAAAVLTFAAAATRRRQDKRALPDFSAFANTAPPAFGLIDPRRGFGPDDEWTGFGGAMSRIWMPGYMEPVFARAGDEPVDAAAIARRIAAIDHALKTLPRQARRLVRLMARRANARPGPGRAGPVRPGLPPGFRKRRIHPVDDILHECHMLVRDLHARPP